MPIAVESELESVSAHPSSEPVALLKLIMGKKERRILFDPLFSNNPIALQVLGICSEIGRAHV